MSLVEMTHVELFEPVRGPGPRNQADVSSAFATLKAKPGDPRVFEPTGLRIVWDRDARAVYLVRPGDKVDPCVIIDQGNVRRMLPANYDWIRERSK